MAHYAFIDENNLVTEVIVGIDESEEIEGLAPEMWYAQFRNSRCIRTSYNSKIRKNFAGIGYFYDEQRDAFIAPKVNCHDEEFFDEESCQWKCLNEKHNATL